MISFFVPGRPRPQGSKRMVRHKHSGKVLMLDASAGLKAWRKAIGTIAGAEMKGRRPMSGPLRVIAAFVFQRPKAHARMKEPPVLRVGNPDIDKLLRAVLDAMTGVVYIDDAQVAVCSLVKRWGNGDEGVSVEVWERP